MDSAWERSIECLRALSEASECFDGQKDDDRRNIRTFALSSQGLAKDEEETQAEKINVSYHMKRVILGNSDL